MKFKFKDQVKPVAGGALHQFYGDITGEVIGYDDDYHMQISFYSVSFFVDNHIEYKKVSENEIEIVNQ